MLVASREAKSEKRKELKKALKLCTLEDLSQQSTAICNAVLQLPNYRAARTVVAYLSCEKLREVDTNILIDDILRRQVKLYVPAVDDKDSNMSMLHLDSMQGVKAVPPFGIREPTQNYKDGSTREELLSSGDLPDIVLLPGLGFDKHCRRLGRGGGYYDKFLARLMERAAPREQKRPTLVGLSFSEQVVDEVPVDVHDHLCDMVITPEQTFLRDTKA
jgi:5-formyltetrahydrofolate cyclo-ligase